ncbi:thioesterase II family protein [Streptomyces parvus]|uniref:thioesterase II family protein n=1 Tax=Streptomyces parvus TaxID=66428 RepID=UPI003628D089
MCFPYAGGNAQAYVGWRRHLAPDIEVCPMQLPGHGERIGEPPRHRWDDLPADIRTGLTDLATPRDRPIALFGHSLGALLAFERARILVSEHGIRPTRLLVSGHRAPHLPLREETLHHLPDTEFLTGLSERSRTLRALTDPEFRSLLLPMLKADCTASETCAFREGPTLTCPITALGGERDEDAPLGEAAAWQRHTTDRFDLTALPGDHFLIDDAGETVVTAVGDRLRSRADSTPP